MRSADCHPDRPHRAKGLCANCYAAQYRAEKRENVRKYTRECEQRRRKTGKSSHYETRYGLSKKQFDALLDLQGSSCAICGELHLESRKLHVDHDHETGVIRGLLCGKCNRGLGMFDDDPNRIDRAARYLRGGTA